MLTVLELRPPQDIFGYVVEFSNDQHGSRFIQQKLMAEYGVSYKKMLWGFAPVPFTYGMFRAINGMGSLPVPSFENAGFLWFTDLASADPYYILPFVSVGMMLGGMKVRIQDPSVYRKIMILTNTRRSCRKVHPLRTRRL